MEYYTIAIIALLAAISPGPDFAVVTKNAIAYGRQHAIMTSLGITAGVCVHITYCVLGLAIVISQSLVLFSIIKYLGAAYLIYLGTKSLLSKEGHAKAFNQTTQVKKMSEWKAFRMGLLTNVLNPKCSVFMLSLFTAVVKPHTPTWVQIIYGFEIAFVTILWFAFLSLGLTHRFIKKKIEKVQKHVTKIIGVVLIGLGIFVIFES